MSGWLALVPAVSELLDRIIPDPEARAKAKMELQKSENADALRLMEAALAADAAQMRVNEAEAQSPHLFVSGWRPFIGWVCGVAFGYHFVVQPLLAFAIANSGGEVKLPAFPMEELSTVLMGLLGLGGLRTLEKINLRR
ncbi:MAG: holin family protein [Rickettsiales bacterium]|nr:holin family protein [Rickettsiales bacterium]